MRRGAAIALALAMVVSSAATARAQTRRPAGTTEPSKIDEAQQRFHQGIELYKEGDLDGALVEFRRAHDLVPNYKILYNLGQVSFQRHDYAAALRYFRQYLTEGDEAIPAERQRQVTRDVADLQQRVGKLEIEPVEDGVEIFVDDASKGTTPLRALITVNSGQRKVEIVARNGEHRSRLVDVAGGEVTRVSFPRVVAQPVDLAPRHRPEPVAVSAPPVTARAAAVPAIAASPGLAAATPPRRSSFPWKSWTLTGLLAGGAAATGAIAWTSKHDLDSQLSMFPGNDVEIDYDRRRARGFALATDGILIGTAIMTTLSLYLTFRNER
jgi:tetratricopeptide (TPR) repeat protein